MNIMHIGLTVTDLNRSVAFYRDVLGLTYVGKLTMEGEETDKLFGMSGCRAEVGYLKCEGETEGPLIELIQLNHTEKVLPDLFRTGISEVCFEVKDMGAFTEKLKAHHVSLLSEPQPFDFTGDGFGRSTALYFRDPDGIILEAMENKS